MKRIIALAAAAVLLLFSAGCGRYTSKYKAVGFVHSNEAAASYMSFFTFDGRMVFKMKSTGEGDLHYSAELESGSAVVYYDYNGFKTELFSVSGGDTVRSHGGYIEAGTVYIIVETNGQCQNGNFEFSLD